MSVGACSGSRLSSAIPALFSEHLRLFEHGGSDITPTRRPLSSPASFGAALLIPLYGNQSTSNPDHLSSTSHTPPPPFFFLLLVGLRSNVGLQSAPGCSSLTTRLSTRLLVPGRALRSSRQLAGGGRARRRMLELR